MSIETELKLALAAEALPDLRAHPLIAEAAIEEPATTLINTYFDTPALELRRSRIAVRLRKSGESWRQTVKCAAASQGGLASRPEWEQPYRNAAFDFASVDHPDVRAQLEAAHPRLAPVFTTTFVRETRRLEPAPGVCVLAMIDQGLIEAAGRSSPICELELELVSGGIDDLFRLAIVLAGDLPLTPEDASKAQRGYDLYHGVQPTPLRNRASPIRAKQDARIAFRAAAFDLLAMWQGNESRAHLSDNPEFVHQARVALRRLRTALVLFAPVLPDAFLAEWKPRLSHLAGNLGEARDADVLYETLLAPIAAHGPIGADLKRLVDKVVMMRNDAREALSVVRHQAGHGRAQLELAAALYALPETATAAVEVLAAESLQRVRRKARMAAQHAADGDILALHRMRIILKRLRYGLEFFAPLLAEKNVRPYIEALGALQEDLGQINDAAVGNRLLADIAGDDPGLCAARAFATGWHAPRIAHLRVRALERAQEVLWTKAPWKKD